jgi:hypothetical protein
MRVTRLDSQLLHVPLSRPRASPAEAAAGRINHVVVLLTHVRTDVGLTGLGFAYLLAGAGLTAGLRRSSCRPRRRPSRGRNRGTGLSMLII